MLCVVFFFFFVKQKTAYEMRISDWSSDVCSSDLPALAQFSNRISKDSRHVLRKRQYFGHLHKEIDRSVVINDASDRRRQFSNITLGHRGIPNSAQSHAYQRVIDVGDKGEIGRAPCRERGCQYEKI